MYPNQPPVEYISIDEAASRARRTRRYLMQLCRDGAIKAQRTGSEWRVETSSLDAFIEEQSQKRARFYQEVAKKRAAEYGKVAPSPVRHGGALVGAALTLVIAVMAGTFALQIPTSRSSNVASVGAIDSIGSFVFHTICPLFGTCGTSSAPLTTSDSDDLPAQEGSLTHTAASTSHVTAADETPEKTVVVNNPVVERIIEKAVPQIVQTGLTASYVDEKIQQLDNKFTSQLNAFTAQSFSGAASYTPVSTQVFAQAARIDQLSGTNISNATIHGGSISGISLSSSDLSGTVSIANGGTGTSTAPSYGQLLLGNAAGGYDLVATSSLGIVGGSPSGAASTTLLSNTGTAYFGGTATTTIDSGGNLTLAGSISGAGLSSCSGTADKLLYDSVSGLFTCGTDQSGGGGGGSDVNWTFFNGSALRPSTTTNQVLIGTNATSSTAKLQVVGGAFFDKATTTSFAIASVTSSLLKTNTVGNVVAATAGTDYENPLTFAYPFVRSTNAISLAFGTTTSNTWVGTQVFTNVPTLATLSGLVGASNGVTYAAATSSATLGLGLTGSIIGVGSSNSLSIATSSLFTFGTGIQNSGGILSIANVPNSALTNSSITVNGSSISLGGSATITAASSTLLADGNVFSGANTFSQTITGSVSGNAGTVTNGVYTTTFNGLFDNRLSATTTLPNITALSNLGTVKTSISGIVKASSGVLSAATAGTDYENPLTFAYPFVRSTNAISLAFGTTTSNTWAGTQVFSNAPTLATLSGLVGASNGVTYAISTSSLNASITGNAGTATALQTARSINGTSFNGTADITITAASSTLLGDSNVFSGSKSIFSNLVGIATTSPTNALEVNGNTFLGGNLTVTGNSITLGTSTSNTIAINSTINSHLIPNGNKIYDLGSPAFYWRNGYIDTITVNSISAASTTIGGTGSNSFTLNSDNATADTEDMSLIFFRGTVVPNAVLSWNSAANKKRFEFNQPVAISDASASTTNPTVSITGTAGQSANILQIASSTGTNIFTVAANGNTTISGNLSVSGTTNLSSLLSLSSASSSLLSVFSKAYFGGTATSTFNSDGSLTLVDGSAAAPAVTGTTNTLAGLYFTSGGINIGINGSNRWSFNSGGGFNAANAAGPTLLNATALSQTNPVFVPDRGDTTTGFGAGTAGNINAIIGGSEIARFTSAGFGVGTSTPSTNLAVQGNALFSGNLSLANLTATGTVTTANLTSTGLLSLANASSSLLSVFQKAYFGGTATSTFDNAGNLTLVSNGLTVGTNQLVVSGGNVGIGTTTPWQALAVAGNLSVTGRIYDNSASAGNNGYVLQSNGTGFNWVATSTLGIAATGGFSWTPTTNFGAAANSTSTPIWFTAGLQASSTSQLAAANFYGNVGVGTSTPFTQLAVVPASTTAQRVGQVTLDSGHAYGLAIQGRYAYVAADGAFDEMAIYDFSNPASPVLVSTTTLLSFGQSIAVQGQYAYLADNDTTNSFEIWNISNPKAPVRVSASSFLHAGYSIAVSGHYVYVGTSGTTLNLEIWDVANPAAPVRVSSSALNNSNGSPNVFVQGNYAYIAESVATNGFEIWNISNPAAPYRVSQSTLSSGSSGIYVQGHYAYITDGEIWDVKNPAAPSVVSSTGASGVKISVAGRYAYIVKKLASGANSFVVEDVSNPAAPAILTTNSLNQIGDSIAVSGRYAVMADDIATNGLEIWDLGGAYIQNIEAGALEAGTLSLTGSLHGVKGTFTDGLTVAQSLNVSGSASIAAATSTFNTTTSIFSVATASSSTSIFSVLGNGNVGVGTTTPFSLFSINPNGIGTLPAFTIGSSTATWLTVDSGGRVGVGTSTPFRKFSVTDTVSAAQVAVAYDATRYTQFQTDAAGDFHLNPSGQDFYTDDSNLWVCTGGSCPAGRITGTGNIVAENKVGIGTSTPTYKLSIETQDNTTPFFQVASSTAQSIFTIGANGSVGIGTSTPWAKFSLGAKVSVASTENTITDAASITINWLDGNQQKVVLGGNRTISFTNYSAGAILRLVICQDATGSRTITSWPAVVLWSSGTAPTLTTTANKCDLISFVGTGATSTLTVFGAAATNF